MNKKQTHKDTLVILGQTGLLGQALYKDATLRSDIDVHGVARKNTKNNIDITDTQKLIAYLDRVRPSHIINTVALVNLGLCEKDPDFAYALHATANKHLTCYCTENNIKLCYISTDHYFTGDKSDLHDEKAPVTLLNEYAKTKYAGEQFVLACPNNIVIRTNIVGFRNWESSPTFVEWAIDALVSGENITAFNDYYTSSIDVKTCSKAVLDLLFSDATGLINVASSECVNKEKFILSLAKHLDLDTSNLDSGSVITANSDVKRAESLGLDVSYAESLLGYKLPRLNGVIDNIASEFKHNQNIKTGS